MEEERDPAGAMPDNTRVRAAMAAFAKNATKEEGASLMITMLREKFIVLVPMKEAPDGTCTFTTVVDGTPHPILHVYTALEEIPELKDEVNVYLFPYADLIVDLLQGEDRWNGVIVDPDAPHSITTHFPPAGGHAVYSTAELRRAGEEVDPSLN